MLIFNVLYCTVLYCTKLYCSVLNSTEKKKYYLRNYKRDIITHQKIEYDRTYSLIFSTHPRLVEEEQHPQPSLLLTYYKYMNINKVIYFNKKYTTITFISTISSFVIKDLIYTSNYKINHNINNMMNKLQNKSVTIKTK